MHVLIWFLCLAVFAVINNAIQSSGVFTPEYVTNSSAMEAGIAAGVVTVLLFALTCFIARTLCKKWDEHKAAKAQPHEPAPSAPPQEDLEQAPEPVIAEQAADAASAPAPPQEPPAPKPTPQAVPAEPTAAAKPRSVVGYCVVIAVLAVALVAVSVVLVVSRRQMSALAAYAVEKGNVAEQLQSQLDEANSQIDASNTEISALNNLLDEAQEKANLYEDAHNTICEMIDPYQFFMEKIGFIVGGSNYYHNYDCSVFQAADEFWAHNVEYCEYLGYSKCPRCW